MGRSRDGLVHLEIMAKKMTSPAETDTSYFDRLVMDCVQALRRSTKEVYVFQYEHVKHIQRSLPQADYVRDPHGIYRVFIPRRK